ncbi:3-methyl-2-oxobutanoate dehydrogenase subunit VorB [Nanoarchaeota archaeon]
MSEKILMKGNQAIAEAAVQAGVDAYFGYPITPQNELIAHMALRMHQEKRVFIQTESEIAAINMVLGAAATGKRVMTSSSSPGISLKQEGISYIAGCEVPCVIVNMSRGGPGLGGIRGAQSDYFQSTRGGGHGDYRLIVFAPSTVQEAYDLTIKAFDLADKYRNPTMILGDAIVGQMMEPFELKPYVRPKLPAKDWALTGADGRERRIVKSLFLHPAEALVEHNIKLQKRYAEITENETLHEAESIDDADLIVVAFGSVGRIAKGAVREARKQGLKVGFIRPITLWPFPTKVIADAAKSCKNFLVVEMNFGQMLHDVKLAIDCAADVKFYGFGGGWYPTAEGILEEVKKWNQ